MTPRAHAGANPAVSPKMTPRLIDDRQRASSLGRLMAYFHRLRIIAKLLIGFGVLLAILASLSAWASFGALSSKSALATKRVIEQFRLMGGVARPDQRRAA